MNPTEERRKRGVRIVAIVVAVLILLALIVPRLVDVNSFRPRLETELTSALGRRVSIGNLSLALFSGTVTADNISIADDPAFSKNLFVTAKSFKASVELMPLIFSKTLHVTGITLEEPQITLLRGPGGNWNFSSIASGAAASSKSASQPATSDSAGTLWVDKLNIDNGRLLIGTANSPSKPQPYEKVNLEVTDFSPTKQFPFTLTAALHGGGVLNLKGKCGPIGSAGTGQTPVDASLKIQKLDLAASGFVSPTTGIQGMADFEGALNSNGQVAKTSGTLTVDKLKVVEKGSPSKHPVAVKYTVEHNLKTDAGTLTQGDISIGKAIAKLTGSYQMQGQTTTLNMKLNGNDMPIDELEAALPAVGVVLPSGAQLQGGSLSTDLAISGPTDKLTITGPIRMSNAKLAGFDLGSKLSAIPALTGKHPGGKDTTIQNFSTAVRMAPEGTQANAINLTIPALGTVTGAGSIAPSGGLSFKMNAALSGAGGVIEKAGIGGQSGSIPFGIEGTISDPKFVPDVKGMVGNVINNKLGESIPKSANPLPGLFRKKK